MTSDDDARDSGEGNDSGDELLREIARIDDEPLDYDANVDRASGSRVGRFVIRDELGRGGMGVVYRAFDESLARTLALKVMTSRAEDRPRDRARFLREARSAASIVHANVVTIYEVGEADTNLYIAMEIVAGESFRSRFKTGRPLPVADVVRIGKGILRGLAAAHAKGIVHRDLKPENIMLGLDGEPKVLDFGLAKLHATSETPREVLEHQPTDAPETENGRVLGTPAYMSPEQAAGKPVDARSDIFSFGVILYEALTGGRPFVGDTSLETLAAIMRDEPAPLLDLNPEVSPVLSALVMKCLAKAPADRPTSADDLLKMLDAIPDETQKPAADSPLKMSSFSSKRVLTFAAVSIAAITVAAVALSHRQRAAEVAAAPAPKPTGILDLPLPKSNNPLAVSAYRAGIQDLHDADWGRAGINFNKAAKLDPVMAAAQMRVVQTESSKNGDRVGTVLGDAYDQAFTFRADLDERNRGVLDAFEPLDRNPQKLEEVLARMMRLRDRFPLDAELWAFVGYFSYFTRGSPDVALASFRRAVDLDPTYADAWQGIAYMAVQASGNSPEALDALDHCIALSPHSPDCLHDRATLEDDSGNCAAMEADAKRGALQTLRASALFATGAPRESIEEVIESNARPAQEQSREELLARLTVLSGDFASAEAQLRAWIAKAVASDPNEPVHARAARVLAELLACDEVCLKEGTDFVAYNACGSAANADPSECKSHFDAAYGPAGCATKLPAEVSNVCFESIASGAIGTVLLHYSQLFCGPPPDDAGLDASTDAD